MAIRGLTLNSQYQILRDGVRFRNIGLNYPGAIQRIFSQLSTTACAYTPSSEQDSMLAIAVSMKVKVLRIYATPYWPAQWTYGVNGGVAGVASTSAQREAHYLMIDAFINKCAALDIGVILCLFFRNPSVPDLAGQTVRAGWLTAGSATRNYAQAVTQDLVTRYLTNSSVYGYEFSNEVNHYNDASDATRGSYPGVNTSYGTPASYSAANDIFNGGEYASVLSWWYGIVSAIDNQRIVLTGNGPNSYSQPGGAGISTPMIAWHQEQVRDNPTNCGSIHYYGNIGYGSANLRGLNAILTGVRWWQKYNKRGFVLGEFGSQPWTITSISGNGTTATFTVNSSCPIEFGDSFLVGGTTTFDGTYTVATVNSNRTSITAACTINATWSGSVKGLQYVSGYRVQRMCNDIINSGTDVALFWQIDSDPLTPILESVNYAGNQGIIDSITAANTRLGW